MIMHVVALVLAAAVAFGPATEGSASAAPSKAAALEPAIADTIERFNKEEGRLRDAPRVKKSGPA